jgi:hypothetical protein
MPDITKIVDQIGPNAISGGFQKGSFKARYQGPKSVAKPPRSATVKPQANGMTIFLFNINFLSGEVVPQQILKIQRLGVIVD